MKSSRNGFTIIELLVVLSIIVVLAGIVYAASGRIRENGRQTVCLSNLKQMGMALSMYCQDADIWDKPSEMEKIPDNLSTGRTNFRTFTEPYGWEVGKLFCPDFQRNGPFQDGYSWYIMGKDPDLSSLESFSQEYAQCGVTVPLFLDEHHNQQDPDLPEPPKILWLVARYDGSVARVQHRPTMGPADTDPCFTGRPTR